MANTKIEWATKVWNPVTGCTPISAGCANCYAKRMANRLKGRHGYDAADPFKVTIHTEDKFLEPLKWRKPSNVFVCSMGDLFHKDVPTLEIDKVFAIAAISPKHNFMFLTKRPDRMATYFDTPAKKLAERWEDVIYSMGISAGDDEIDTVASFLHNRCGLGWPLKNIWLGVSVEDQKAADDRIHYLNEISAAVKFVSCEPLLSEINFEKSLGESLKWHAGGLKNCISWVISGGETGHNARPVHPDWVRSIKDQCEDNGVPFFFKGWGEFKPINIDLTGIKPIRQKGNPFTFWENIKGDIFELIDGDGEYLCAGDDHQLYQPIIKVGKKQSGDLLDGKQYHEFPKI
jgi:protein gp37